MTSIGKETTRLHYFGNFKRVTKEILRFYMFKLKKANLSQAN